ANIVDVRVLGRTGSGRISSVALGIEWVIAHRSTYNIRIISLSFGAPAVVSYRTDPMSAAIEIAWRLGLVVVAASGNGGPGRDTVVSPGIDPYAITVGASDDQGTVSRRDDTLAWFSAWGTADSNAKPDLVAPGRRIVSIRVPGSALDMLFPNRVVTARNGSTYMRLSGTSMATPVVSGAAALLLERQPNLSPAPHPLRTPPLPSPPSLPAPLGRPDPRRHRLANAYLGQRGLGQHRLGQLRLGQHRLGQHRMGQRGLGQHRLGQHRVGQCGLGQH